MNGARGGLAGAAALLLAFLPVAVVPTGPAHADADDAPAGPTQMPQSRSAEVNAKRAIGADEIEGPTIFEGVPALNPIDAARDTLRDRYGFYLHGEYLGDPYGDVSGGVRRGSTYSGRLDLELDVNGAKAFGLAGTTLHANMFQIHGEDLSASHVGNLLSINDIGALPSTRLYELWFEQKFGDNLSLRAGQLGIDVEFLTSDYGANFINATFGWPGLPSVDLPDGGPAYPLATPAARLKYRVNDDFSLLAAVFDGVPAGPCAGDGQSCDKAGLNFRVDDPPLVIAEAHYAFNRGAAATGLPGTLKLGAFGQFGSFADERFGVDGLGLNTPGSNGVPIEHRRDGGFYAVLDKQVYRLPGDDPEKGIGVFARAIGAPPDRNLVDFYLDGGVTALGLVPGRPSDLIGLAGAFAKISAAVNDAAVAAGSADPTRDYEALVELTYQATVLPGFAVQPTLEFIAHPGGHAVDPGSASNVAIPNALVIGTTVQVRF